MSARAGAATAGVAALVGLVAGCGSTSFTTSPAQPAATAAAIDRCLVGTWRSVSITGALGDGHGGTVAITGGAGQVLTIGSDGRLAVDNTATRPDTGTATDGSTYAITQTGSSTGHVTSSGTRLGVTLDHPEAMTNTITRDGAVVASAHPSPATDSYVCSAGQALAITSSGGAVSRFDPAG